MPQISIIVPIYKVDQYLQRCVDSILAQTFTDYELILIDDGSPDLSGQIDDEYAVEDGRIVSVHHKNGGASSARNAGLDVVQGENITFIDPDDYVLPAYIREMYQPEYDMVCQTLVMVGEDGHIIQKGELPKCTYFYPNENDIMVMLLNKALSYAPCKCYKSSIIQTNGIRFKIDIDNGEDILFSVQYIKKARSVLVQSVSNYRYVRYESHTTLSRPNSKQRIDMVINAYRLISLEVSDNPDKQKEIFIKKSLWAYNKYWGDYYAAYSPFRIIPRLSCLYHLAEDPGFHIVLRSGVVYDFTDEICKAILSGRKMKVTFEYIHYCLYLLKKRIFHL